MIISEQDILACRFIHVSSEPNISVRNRSSLLPLLLSSGHTESPSIPPLTKDPGPIGTIPIVNPDRTVPSELRKARDSRHH